jgi:hypothetical protein
MLLSINVEVKSSSKNEYKFTLAGIEKARETPEVSRAFSMPGAPALS